MRQIKNVENLVLDIMHVKLVNGEIKQIGFSAIIGFHPIFPIVESVKNCITFVFTQYGIWKIFLFHRNIEPFESIKALLLSKRYDLLYKFKRGIFKSYVCL